jgi:2-polyprenyl-3-methyl-5-hydroxy-6-metoxy-1,4-benzoquinol methylase
MERGTPDENAMMGILGGNDGAFVVEDGVIAGNVYDKYTVGNFIVRRIMHRFMRDFDYLVAMSQAMDVHEVGCGEGHLSMRLGRKGLDARGSDFSIEIISAARQLSEEEGLDVSFSVRSIYELDPHVDGASLVICSEVLEHLEEPDRALQSLAGIARPFVLVSVPREPIWRILNMARGKYLGRLGNTPGHVQHWSRRGFLAVLKKRFDIVATRTPMPWTMALCRVR